MVFEIVQGCEDTCIGQEELMEHRCLLKLGLDICFGHDVLCIEYLCLRSITMQHVHIINRSDNKTSFFRIRTPCSYSGCSYLGGGTCNCVMCVQSVHVCMQADTISSDEDRIVGNLAFSKQARDLRLG